MALDDVSIDDGRMARIELPRYPVFAFQVSELLSKNIFLDDFKTVGLQVTHPLRAATSRRVGINRDGRRAGNRLRMRCRKRG